MATAPDARKELLSFDWLGACQRAVEGLREVLLENPTSNERVIETGETGGAATRRWSSTPPPRTPSSASSTGCTPPARASPPVSEERGYVDFGSDEVSSSSTRSTAP
jgi:myo-inositol-1(or 4)-monophosphatase